MFAPRLSHFDLLDKATSQLDQQAAEQMRAVAAALTTWDSLPGINQRIAEIIVAEIGADLAPFADADQLASWAGMCPGNNESAGKRKSGRTRQGSPWLRRALVEAAHGAAHTKHKYFQALYRRLAARRGKQRAAVAVGHSLLVTGYHLITRQTAYEDLGGNYFDERDREAVKRRAVRRLEKLGYRVELAPSPP
jgi:transposase